MWVGLNPLQRCSQYILSLQPNGLEMNKYREEQLQYRLKDKKCGTIRRDNKKVLEPINKRHE